ncbi:MAG: ribonuclease J [Hyphomonadaceae bacterium]
MADKQTDNNELVFLPLGGCNEIGMNLNCYGYGPAHDRRWILVDVGVTFGNTTTPGIDLICPDPQYIEEMADKIDAIFLTHAHEDHIGALGLLWPRLKAPMYATPFTAYMIAGKLAERGIENAPLNVIPLGGEVETGPFKVKYITLTHSIPEPNALAIETPAGIILHTGDWKLDPEPQVGEPYDSAALKALGDKGVLAMICDSTNVFEEGEAGSEATVRKALTELIGTLKGRVAVTTFASNVARVVTVIEAAKKAGRSVCLVGRSMHKITDAAKATGIIDKGYDFVDEGDAGSFPNETILYLCTGSQGEERAALSRIARNDHRNVTLGEGDTVIFSSRVIPGNESGIYAMQNQLAEKGVQIITDRMTDDIIHVSGHPCRDELRRMYQWVRPKISVPVHGERRHILEHAAYAKSLQVSEAVTPRNGDLIRLAPGKAKVIDEVPSGRLFLDGNRLVPEQAQGMNERLKLARTGILNVALALDDAGYLVDGPIVTARGFSETDGRVADESLEALDDAAEAGLKRMKKGQRSDDEQVERAVFRAVRKASEKTFGRRPVIDIAILRV